jgi:hypothetical protein
VFEDLDKDGSKSVDFVEFCQVQSYIASLRVGESESLRVGESGGAWPVGGAWYRDGESGGGEKGEEGERREMSDKGGTV